MPSRRLCRCASTPPRRPFPPPAGGSGKRPQNKGPRPITHLTLNLRIELSRTYWHARGIGGCVPVDALLDRTQASVSLGVVKLACLLNATSRNFDRCAEGLKESSGIEMSGELLRQIVEAEGKAVQAAMEASRLPAGFSAEDCKLEDGTSRVYMGADGVMVPMVTQDEKDKRRKKVRTKRRKEAAKAKRREKADAAREAKAAEQAQAAQKAEAERRSKAATAEKAVAGKAARKPRPLAPAKAGADQKYKEFKIVTFYDQDQEHRIVSVTRGDCDAAGAIMRRDACRINLSRADDKVGMFDGSPWIHNQVVGQSLNLDAEGLDFYHLADNTKKCRNIVFGEENPAGQEWVAQVLHTVKHEGFDAYIAKLEELRRRVARSRAKAAEVDRLIAYARTREDMINYPEFLSKGRQIGSGPTESMCKVTTQRLKGSGMRWDGDNGEALMALEALYQSGQWESWWKLRLSKAG